MTFKPVTAWKPILQGAEAELARSVACEIGRDLQVHPAGQRTTSGVSTGEAGMALTFATLAEQFPEFADEAQARLARAVDLNNASFRTPTLHAGVAGLAWVAQHVLGPDDDDAKEIAKDVDGYLAEFVEQRPWEYPLELEIGLTGIGIYALSRPKNSETRRILDACVGHLAELVEPREGGCAWRTTMRYAMPDLHARYPRGMFDLGAAHGIPPIIAFLAACERRGVQEDVVAPLWRGAFCWMVGLAQTSHHLPQYGAFFHGDELVSDADTFRWCVGDPGISANLVLAAALAGGPSETAAAWAVARRSAEFGLRRPEDGRGNLCCGAAGRALISHRLFLRSGEPLFERAALNEYRSLLRLRSPGSGIGGYNEPMDDPPSSPNPTFLYGAGGIALALLAASSAQPPVWDGMLSLSLPAEDEMRTKG